VRFILFRIVVLLLIKSVCAVWQVLENGLSGRLVGLYHGLGWRGLP
jgi:hypothetical protein